MDLFQREMERANQLEPAQEVIERAEKTLRGGGSLYVVSDLPIWLMHPARTFPPAKIPRDGWRSAAYEIQWTAQVGDALHKHSTLFSSPKPLTDEAISHYENVSLAIFRGWRE